MHLLMSAPHWRRTWWQKLLLDFYVCHTLKVLCVSHAVRGCTAHAQPLCVCIHTHRHTAYYSCSTAVDRSTAVHPGIHTTTKFSRTCKPMTHKIFGNVWMHVAIAFVNLSRYSNKSTLVLCVKYPVLQNT